MTQVPLAPEVVSGLINLRGQIVSAIDLRRRLRLEDRPQGQLPMNVVVRTDDGAVSLLVDEIGDVLEVEEGCFEPARENWCAGSTSSRTNCCWYLTPNMPWRVRREAMRRPTRSNGILTVRQPR